MYYYVQKIFLVAYQGSKFMFNACPEQGEGSFLACDGSFEAQDARGAHLELETLNRIKHFASFVVNLLVFVVIEFIFSVQSPPGIFAIPTPGMHRPSLPRSDIHNL